MLITNLIKKKTLTINPNPINIHQKCLRKFDLKCDVMFYRMLPDFDLQIGCQNRPKAFSKWTFEKVYNFNVFQCDREKPWLLNVSPGNDFSKKDAQRHSEPFAPIFN